MGDRRAWRAARAAGLPRWVAAGVLLAGPAMAARAGPVEFADGAFAPEHWTQFRYLGGRDAIGGVFNTEQAPEGGAPGPYRLVSHVWTGPGDLIVVHLRQGAVHDPAVSGAIESVDAWIDAEFSPVVDPFFVMCGPALVQGGRLYILRYYATSPNWARLGGSGFTAEDFEDFYDPAVHPDFSAAGPPVQLGIFTSNGIHCACGRTTPVGIDNWFIRLHTAGGECRADLTGDGLIDFTDYLEFLNRYDALDPSVDFNEDGLVDFGDYLEFLNLYEAGC